MNSLSEPKYDVQKQVNVYRAILKTKTLSENVVLKMSLLHNSLGKFFKIFIILRKT